MDLTYTNPSYIPVYSLDGIPNSLLEVRTLINAVKQEDPGLTVIDSFFPKIVINSQTLHRAMLTGEGKENPITSDNHVFYSLYIARRPDQSKCAFTYSGRFSCIQ